ncbi:Uncharacterised protein [Vibrio cholerae]|nr:Uncharacterised protein [Vibrio cholerae]
MATWAFESLISETDSVMPIKASLALAVSALF